jgi:DegV family protein with EDD domain
VAEASRTVGLLTDSTAYLPAGEAAAAGVEVVPLQVVVGGRSLAEGTEVSSADVAEALRAWQPVSTSRPSPALLAEAYARLADGGAREVVSVHLSAEISGTVEAARLAAREAPVPVHVVDSRALGLAMGLAVLAGARRADDGGDGADVARAVRRHAELTSTFFYVDTLEHLRRGGRIGTAQAVLGSALGVKPLLVVDDGRIVPLEKVRTAGRALARLEDLAAGAAARLVADGAGLSLAVQHLAAPERAEQLAARLASRYPQAAPPRVAEVGAVVGAHAGPGMLAVVVGPALPSA